MVAEFGLMGSLKSFVSEAWMGIKDWGVGLGGTKTRHGCSGDWRSTQLPRVEKCRVEGREMDSVVTYLEGVLLRSPDSYAYFMLVAYEVGSPLRALLLLLLSPLLLALQYLFPAQTLAFRGFALVSLAGLKASRVRLASRATLCKFYMQDLRLSTYRVLASCGGQRTVVTLFPRIMVEPFLQEYLGVKRVIGTEVHTLYGYCTGLLTSEGVCNPASFIKYFQEISATAGLQEGTVPAVVKEVPEIGLISDYHHRRHNPFHGSFVSLCKEVYVVAALGSESEMESERVPREKYLKPLVFHDGRLVMKPTQLTMLLIFLWMPVGAVLSILRSMTCLCLPVEVGMPLSAFLGVRMLVRGGPPRCHASDGTVKGGGVLFVCTHRTLLDPVYLTAVLRQKVNVVTYSLSRLTELMSPIKTVRLTRNRELDAKAIDKLLQEGDLVICPEGTTCREPYLLRFSPLFAELTDDICPVAMKVSVNFFYGTTASGWKSMDAFYFLMNPRPKYEINILDPLPKQESCSTGNSSIHVANYLQQRMALALGYECTNFTRRDKYQLLASTDGY